jgi:hypothetical protein
MLELLARVEGDDDPIAYLRARGARDDPGAARYTAQGFLQWFVERAADRPMCVENTRPSRDRLPHRAGVARSHHRLAPATALFFQPHGRS